MRHFKKMLTVGWLFLIVTGAGAQETSSPAAGGKSSTPTVGAATVRGCLRGSRGNYVLMENNSNLAYVLKGVGNKLDAQLRHEVEVTGRVLPGTVKTGIRPEKAGSNPSDTTHGVDGVTLQVAGPEDVHTISKKCKAADQ